MHGVWVKWMAGLLLLMMMVPRIYAESGDQTPMELRQIMQDMSAGMQEITEAITLEDWSTVAAQAPFIANQPQPSMGERLRILRYFAAETGQFKRFYDETHEAAMALQASALLQDSDAVIADFARLQGRCLACHRQYRQAFVEKFYGDKETLAADTRDEAR